MSGLFITNFRQEGVPHELVFEILNHLDIPTSFSVSEINRQWRSFMLGTHGGENHTDRTVPRPFRCFSPSALSSLLPKQELEERPDEPGVRDPGMTTKLKIALFRCWDLVKDQGGFLELYLPSAYDLNVETSLIMEMIERSAERLRALDIYFNPKYLPEKTGAAIPLDAYGGHSRPIEQPEPQPDHSGIDASDWTIYTHQERLDGAVHRIFAICSQLRHLGIACPYQRPQPNYTDAKCNRIIFPEGASTMIPSLRSLAIRDLKPQYDMSFFQLSMQLHVLKISGLGIERDCLYLSGDPKHHLGIMSPTALRVLLRFLERGQRIERLSIEEPFEFVSFAATALFDGVDAGLIHPDEIDPRWRTRLEAQGALDEHLVGYENHDRDEITTDVAPDFLRGVDHRFHGGSPRKIHLPTLKELSVQGVDTNGRNTSPLERARQEEVGAIIAPNLVAFSVDNPTAALAGTLSTCGIHGDGLSGLRKLYLRRPDANSRPRFTAKLLLAILRTLPHLETLTFDFRCGGNLVWGDDDTPLSVLSVLNRLGDTPNAVPLLRELVLINDESATGAALVSFVKKRSALYLQSSDPISPQGRSLQTLVVRSFVKPIKMSDEEQRWLSENLVSFVFVQSEQ